MLRLHKMTHQDTHEWVIAITLLFCISYYVVCQKLMRYIPGHVLVLVIGTPSGRKYFSSHVQKKLSQLETRKPTPSIECVESDN